jgi:hypothetical protein
VSTEWAGGLGKVFPYRESGEGRAPPCEKKDARFEKVLTSDVAAFTKYLRAAGEGNRREDAIGFETSENGDKSYRPE